MNKISVWSLGNAGGHRVNISKEGREEGREQDQPTLNPFCIMTIAIRFGSQAQRVILLLEEMREQGAPTPHLQGAESSSGSP